MSLSTAMSANYTVTIRKNFFLFTQIVPKRRKERRWGEKREGGPRMEQEK